MAPRDKRRLKRLVLLGGGHSQCAVLARFAREPAAQAEIVLVSPARHAVYSGMVPGWIAGEYAFEECRIDLQALAARAGVRCVEARAVALDADARRIVLDDGGAIDYDLLSIDIGSAAAVGDIAGAQHAIVLRPIEALPPALEAFDTGVREGAIRGMAVVGAGAAGTEVLLTLMHRAAVRLGTPIEAVLVGDARGLLPGHGGRARALVARELARRGAMLRTGAAVRAIGEGGIVLDDADRIAADAVILAAGAAPHPWLAASTLARDRRGFMEVDAMLRSTSHPEVFGSGDCATQIGNPGPKSGVFAVRQGPVLAASLASVLRGGGAQAFQCSPAALAIFNLGGGRAIASWKSLAVEGRWVWRWKDRLDRRFVAGYRRAAY